jgi:hypothetical protein
MDVTEITVPVPTDRVPEFYRWFADWVEDTDRSAPPTPPARDPGDNTDDAAARWWASLGARERQIFSLWIDATPRLLTADEIIQAMSLKGPRDIPGILAWPKRKGAKVGFHVTWNFRRDPLTNGPMYGIEDTEYARLLRRARSTAEGS